MKSPAFVGLFFYGYYLASTIALYFINYSDFITPRIPPFLSKEVILNEYFYARK